MILITGGTGQGKTAYALDLLHLTHAELTDGASCSPEEALSAKILTQYALLVRRLEEPLAFTERLCRTNPGAVILLDEIGCGIVPLDKSERLWRENVGRCGCLLAAHAETVIRMVCGIPTVIKGVRP